MHEQAYEPVTVELGGQQRKLRLTLRAVRLIKQHAGADALTGESDPMAMVDRIGVIVWAMLGDSSLTIEQVEDMIEMRDMERISAAIAQVFNVDLPADEGKAAAAPST